MENWRKDLHKTRICLVHISKIYLLLILSKIKMEARRECNKVVPTKFKAFKRKLLSKIIVFFITFLLSFLLGRKLDFICPFPLLFWGNLKLSLASWKRNLIFLPYLLVWRFTFPFMPLWPLPFARQIQFCARSFLVIKNTTFLPYLLFNIGLR